MPELGHDYDSLRREVAVYLGFDRDPANWTTAESQDVDDIITHGLQLFYVPNTDNKRNITYRWTFLTPIGVVVTVPGVDTYLLSEDFGGMDGDMVWRDSSQSATTRIKLINESYFRTLRQAYQNTTTITGPCYAAIWPERLEGQSTQRYILGLTPTPGSAVPVEFRYYAVQQRISAERPIALGMPMYADALRASVIAAAELRMNDRKGERWQDYMQRIQVAIDLDKRNMAAEALPMIVDRSSMNAWQYSSDNISINVRTTGSGGVSPPPSGGGGFDGGFSGGFG